MTALGDVILGKYCLLEKLGKGGAGQVYLARDKKLGKLWAVKETEELELGEIRMLKELSHAMLPRLVDWGRAGDRQYIVMDYIQGRDLQSLLEEMGPFPRKQVLEWGIKICQVLTYLHTRIPPVVYGDLKPGNLMLDMEGSLFLVDFGAACRHSLYRQPEQCRGTKAYAAPEQLAGNLGTAADVYALGKTLLALAGGSPSSGRTLRKISRKCCQRDPDKRYAACEDLEKVLQKAMNGFGWGRAAAPLAFLGLAAATLAVGVYCGQEQPLRAPEASLFTLFPEGKQQESFSLSFARLRPELLQVLAEKDPDNQEINKCLGGLSALVRDTSQPEGRLRCLELMGKLYELGGEPELAQSVYQQLLLLYPEEIDVYCFYGQLLLEQGDTEKAGDLREKAGMLAGSSQNHNLGVFAQRLETVDKVNKKERRSGELYEKEQQ